jgi:beta-barrel assembly-enhancing protease
VRFTNHALSVAAGLALIFSPGFYSAQAQSFLGGMLKSIEKEVENPAAGSGLNIGGTSNDLFEAEKNSRLGPMGRFFLGRKLSAHVLGNTPAIPVGHPISQYVRHVALTILGSSNYAGSYSDPIVIVLKDNETINAFAAPGNFVFITTGMLNFLKNEDELAFVLAHEIAHIELDHGLNAIKSKQGADLFKGAVGNGVMDGLDGLFNFMEDGFSAELEGEADRRGAELAAKSGYDPAAGKPVIKRLENKQGRKHATGYPEDRQANIELVIRNSKPIAQSSIKSRASRYKLFVK